MNREFAERYFGWLAEQINVDYGNRPKEYDGLFRHIHSKDFIWIVPNDDNRVGDALELRREFWDRRPIPRRGVSTLEVLVALSRRLEFNAGGDRELWAGQLIKNLGLQKMFDPVSSRKHDRIDEVLDTLIWRTYEPNGEGGLFPLRYAKEDQTKVEIWYQMSAYIIENTVD